MVSRIREVWADNLEVELVALRNAIDSFPVVSITENVGEKKNITKKQNRLTGVSFMGWACLIGLLYNRDTEFPGIIARPMGNFKTGADYHYQTMRCNVDLLKLIQLGVTLSDEDGNLPDACTWQFNFKFSLSEDMYAPDSIELLEKSGIEFKLHEERGIDVEYLGELLTTSGLVLFEDVKWISFHSGYDFGYLIKILTSLPLPATEEGFLEVLERWFPNIYDIKHIMRSCKTLKGGLQDVADSLQVTRIGTQHQAGSDSLLTAATFFKMRKVFFEDKIEDEFYRNFLYGFGNARQREYNGTPRFLPALTTA
ncbi:mRNA deadenylase subunit [Phaffia rhodozyma]|uniref:poly(A)-specific ribonuclease n=1 Tax=Phaffia rhodozyma TaxID=264483 RepID=A0A0F7SLE0_PHARH|nr:mRNA deadenylase subunit [Phaffia rhodozyma]